MSLTLCALGLTLIVAHEVSEVACSMGEWLADAENVALLEEYLKQAPNGHFIY